MNDSPAAEMDVRWKLDLLRTMLRIRRFEQEAIRWYSAWKIGGWLILTIGQEMVAAGVRSVMGPLDHSITGPRGMGHALAAGMAMAPCMAELYGKAAGCSKGKGGAFSFYAPQLRHWGCHGLAATQTPLAAGLAFALKQRGEPGAVVCFLGDGAVNQGVYHEALNLAGLFDLPVVFIIENNGYSMGTSVPRSSRFKECLARRAEAYDIAWDRFDDLDGEVLRDRVSIALERARKECRPTVLEIETYRYYGFSLADANSKKYRTVEEIEARKARDPLRAWQERLLGEGLLTPEAAEAMDQAAKAEAEAATRYAEAARPPSATELLEDVYWETDAGWNGPGRMFFD